MVTEIDRRSEALIVDGILGRTARRRRPRRGGRRPAGHLRRPLDHRPPRRHHQLPLRLPRLRRVDRAPRSTAMRQSPAWSPTRGPDEVFTAVAGRGATLQRAADPVHRRAPSWPRRSWPPASPTTPSAARRQAAVLAEVLPQVRDIRRAGAAAVDLCSVGRRPARRLLRAGPAALGLRRRRAHRHRGGRRGRRPRRRPAVADLRPRRAPALFEPLRALLRRAGAADA